MYGNGRSKRRMEGEEQVQNKKQCSGQKLHLGSKVNGRMQTPLMVTPLARPNLPDLVVLLLDSWEVGAQEP